jgi:frataxin-like iron-binding protein CyaY
MELLFSLMKNLLIVARYNEDISWVDQLDCDVIIYNKGEDLDPKYNVVKLENYGRETETYLRAICSLYEKIKDEYDHVSFLQGNPFDHYENVLSLLPDEKRQYAYPIPIPGKNTVWVSVNQVGYAFKTGNNYFYDNSICNDAYWFILRETLSKLRLPWYGVFIDYPGAQFIIPKKYIVSKSIDWWENAYGVFDYSEKNNYKETGYPGMPYVFERLWHTIWTHY